jgi:hypothetical protein
MLNVGECSVRRAKKVVDDASPSLLAKAARGEVAVSVAPEIAELDEEEQEEGVARGEAEILRKSKDIKCDRAKAVIHGAPVRNESGPQ